MTGGGTIEIERDVAAPMRDGVLLRADVWRAADGRARPAIVYRAPYDKRMLTALDVLPPYLAAEAGYAVVLQDTRGRFASEGEWEPVLWEQEGRDTYDTVEWVAEQPGATATWAWRGRPTWDWCSCSGRWSSLRTSGRSRRPWSPPPSTTGPRRAARSGSTTS
nr:CocE/NonD family hydrolase [Allosalinactinospora lopnorensis]